MTDVTRNALGGDLANEPFGTIATPTNQGENHSFEPAPPLKRKVRQSAAIIEAETESLLVAGIETAQAKAEEVQRWAKQKEDTARAHVRAHPISSCATVFGLGLILGLLARR
jgi:hypothetical protein